MGYIDQNLMPGEKITYRAKLHWGIFITPGGLLLFGVLISIGDAAPGTLVMLAGFVIFLLRVTRVATSEFAVTNKRVVMKTGFIRRDSLELFLAKVEGIGVNQSMLGRALDYGTIIITGTGGMRTPFKGIAAPMEFRDWVYAHLSRE